MPVTGRKPQISCALFIAILTMLATGLPAQADRAQDVLKTVNYIATALADENPNDAMKPFDKSFVNYSKLLEYFTALTNAFQVVSEIDLADEQGSDADSRTIVGWSLTLTSKETLETERRSSDINIRLVREGEKWKIIEFSPVDLFNPQQKHESK